MKRPLLNVLVVLPLTAALAVACAPGKNKKEALTRLGGRSKVMTQKPATQTNPLLTDAPNLSPATTTTDGAPSTPEDDVIEVTTSRCRISDDPAIAEDYKKLAFCDGFKVDIESDGKILFANKIDLENQNPIALDLASAKIKDKKVRLEWTSKQVKENNILHLGFNIPHKKSELDLDKNIEVFINARQVDTNLVELLFPQTETAETGEVTVRLKEASLIENINFKIVISYKLK